MDDYQARQLALRLQTIPPGARLEITWTDHTDTIQTTGVVTDHEPDTGYRQITTDDRTLEVVPAGDHSQIAVREPTPTSTHTHGELTAIDIQTVPLFEAPLTDEGFEVPEPLVGLTGYVTVDLPTRNHVINLADHGLEETDYRLIGNIGTDPDPDLLPDDSTAIRPETGPHYYINVVDERSNPEPPAHEPIVDDQKLQSLRQTVQSLKAAPISTLPTGISADAHAQFGKISRALQAAHQELCTAGTPPDPTADLVEEPDYQDAVGTLETDLEACRHALKTSLSAEQWEPVNAHLETATLELRTLRQILAETDQDSTATESHSSSPEIPQWIIEPHAPAPIQGGDTDDE